MPRGGARANSGPPPDPNALRRDRPEDQAGWETLPPEGRKGAAPTWPLTTPTAREKKFWTAEWKRPQAVIWERNGQELEVALYVRTFAAAEKKDAGSGIRNLVKQQQENLGLSLPGLARNRWKIGEAAPTSSAAAAPKRPQRDSRLKVLEGGRP